MSDYTRNYNFTAGEVIDPDEVDEEFNDVATAIASKPDANGAVQPSLNADMVDGFHAANDGGDGTIPVCSGDIQTNLNAEMVGGLTASDIGTAGFPAGTKMVFYQSSAPSGWTKQSNPSIDRVVGVSSAGTGGSANSESGWSNANFTTTIASHTLTIAQVPAASVTIEVGATLDGSGLGSASLVHQADGSTTPATFEFTDTTNGGGGSHGHPGSTVEMQNDYRPPILWCIIASKD